MKRFIVSSPFFVLLFVVIASTQALVSMNDHVTDYGLIETYAQTAWPSLHRDSRNSDFSPFVAPVETQTKWTALDNDAVIAAVTIGPEGNLYVTTGQATGSNLHAFNRNGLPLWSQNVDSLAVGGSAIVDSAGDVYVSDADQLWAFHADGSLKWVVPIPDTLPANFVTAIFTMEGFVGGITTNGKVVLFNRPDGTLVSTLTLPTGVPLPATPTPPRVWQGLMDPAIISGVYASFFGTGSQVANTPAVNPLNNRIYITAAGPDTQSGRLYGIDVTPSGALSIAFSASMGPGSGTSPTISPDGTQVYVSDGVGNLYAFDAFTGAQKWHLSIGTNVASPSVGPDGTIFSLGDGKLVAISEDGIKQYQVDFNSLAVSTLPPIGPLPRVGRVNSIVSVTPNHLYLTVNMAYQLPLPSGGTFLVPARIALLVIDPSNGTIVAPPALLRDTTEGILTMASDGSIYIVHGAIASSIAFYGVIPFIQNEQLRNALFAQVVHPIGGVSALEPVSFLDLAESGIQWVQDLDAVALSKIDAGSMEDVDDAYTQVRRGTVQLGATFNSISDAEAGGEIDSQSAQQGRQRVNTAQTLLNDAKNLIAQARIAPNDGLLVSARELIENAENELEQALSILTGSAAPPLTKVIPTALRFSEEVPLKSELGQNYPNPFNPETWMPYTLAQDSDVQIHIYDFRGQLVRTLNLGHQRAGRYHSPEAAAHWDGRNSYGEQVSSGVYIYQLVTPHFQQMKQMVILK